MKKPAQQCPIVYVRSGPFCDQLAVLQKLVTLVKASARIAAKSTWSKFAANAL
jgi:hypothetical protein